MDNNQYRAAGVQLDEDLENIRDRLYALEGNDDVEVDLEELADSVATILDERATEAPEPEPPTGLTEEQRAEVIELIGEHAPEGGSGDVGEDLRRRLEAMLARLDASLKELEKDLSRVVGPPPEGLDGKYHSTAGWGVHFEAEYPIRLLEATVKAFKSGYVNLEVHRYDHVEDEPLGVVDSTLVDIAGEGQHTIDLDLEIYEPGHYVLTRDSAGSPPDEDRVALRRTEDDYGGWASDSGDGVTFHGGVDVEGRWGSNRLWYYFADLRIRDAVPDVGDGDGGDIDDPDGFGEGSYGDGPYGDGDEDEQERPTFG